MRIVMIMCLAAMYVSMTGCIVPLSATEALWLDDSQVDNSLKIRESKDTKTCFEVTGTATVNAPGGSITGGARGAVATGKKMSIVDCMQYLFGEAPNFEDMRNVEAQKDNTAQPEPIHYLYWE